MDGCAFYYTWMPDSDHLILLFFNSENSTGAVENHWYVATLSTKTVREIIIPELDLKTNDIDGIYVQPIRP
jgi:hypothetical protein